MDSKTPSPDQRIIAHMNSGHQDSLVRYLEYYCNVPSHTARKARLTSMTLSHMQLSTSSKADQYLVPINPPLTSWSEARPRVVEMDKTCIAKLGRSDVTLNKYMPPQGAQAVIFGFCLFSYILYHRRDALLPGDDWVWGRFARMFPGVFAFFYKVQPWAFYPMLGIHLCEAAYMDRVVRKHSVPRLSRTWWLWVGSCAIEGFGSFQRIKAFVAKERERKEKQNH